MLDLWLVCFSASYSTLAQFMMNYGNEWDMDLILSYVGTQIWGTPVNHVLLLTSRKSCLVTSRGKLVHRANTGWDVEGARLRALEARTNSLVLDCRGAPSSGSSVALRVFLRRILVEAQQGSLGG